MADDLRSSGTLRGAMLALAVWGALPSMLLAADATRPNVVLILIDDLGGTDLGCYGSKYHHTPHLDKLAAQGLRFTEAYASCPVCSPTRAALLTGKYPARLHLTDYIPGERDPRKHRILRPEFHQELPLAETTIAELLSAHGYQCAAIGKWHLGGEGYEPQRQGFQHAVGGIDRGSVASHFAPYLREGRKLPGLEPAPAGEYLADRLTSEAEKFLANNASKPFFLYLPHYAVHTPLQGKAALVDKYKAAGSKLLQHNPQFAAMVENMDDGVGRILGKLDELKLAENTLVIFTSDNGGLATSGNPTGIPATNNAPLREGKGYLYEGGIRVPLIVRWPGHVKPDTVSDAPTSSIDLFATIADVCGVKPAQPVDGISIKTVFEGGPPPQRDALYWHYPHYSPQGGRPGGAIRQGDYKLIEFYERGRRELFNLDQDPSESTNLIDREPERAAQMAGRLKAWLKDVSAAMPTPNPDFVPDEQADDGSLTLLAETADVHGVMLRYEPLPHKNTLGFWVRKDDWASWDFRLTKPGQFTLEILQGCGPGSEGSHVEFTVGDQHVVAEVVKTHGFQDFVKRSIGTITLDEPGAYTLSVKPLSKPGAAVMDLRQVRLVPVADSAK